MTDGWIARLARKRLRWAPTHENLPGPSLTSLRLSLDHRCDMWREMIASVKGAAVVSTRVACESLPTTAFSGSVEHWNHCLACCADERRTIHKLRHLNCVACYQRLSTISGNSSSCVAIFVAASWTFLRLTLIASLKLLRTAQCRHGGEGSKNEQKQVKVSPREICTFLRSKGDKIRNHMPFT